MSGEIKKGVIFVPYMSGKGGTERVIQNLFLSLQSKKVDFKLSVFSIGGSDNYDWSKKIPIKILKTGKSRTVRMIFYSTLLPFVLFNYIRRNHLDFVVSTNPIMWFISKISIIILRRNTKVIAWYHYSLRQKPIKNFILFSADYFLAISSGIEKQILNLGFNKDRVSLIYNPVQKSFKIINRPDTGKKFIYIGRVMLDGQKNLRELFLALKNVSGEWKLDVYGDTSDAEPVKSFANSLGIEHKINWRGFVEDPWDDINEGTALILTSKYEGLPMVLCEAISHGLYIISSNVETGPSDIINSSNGMMYESGNTSELTGIIQDVVNNKKLPDHDIIMKTSKKFQIDSYAENFINAINKALIKER